MAIAEMAGSACEVASNESSGPEQEFDKIEAPTTSALAQVNPAEVVDNQTGRARVWLPDEQAGWLLAEILGTDGEDAYSAIFLQTPDDAMRGLRNSKTRRKNFSVKVSSLPTSRGQNAGPNLPLHNESLGPEGVADMRELVHLHEAALLDNLRRRFFSRLPYTYAGSVLISVNPYHWLDIYRDKAPHWNRASAADESSPHPYAISLATFDRLLEGQVGSTILVSGDSGSGKTEVVKLLTEHIANLSMGKDRSSPGEIVAKVVESNPLLETFGNARTPQNDNSSRFSKYVKLQFDSRGRLLGSVTSVYLLEKSRIVFQDKGNQNFHIFYQIFYLPRDVLNELQLTDISAYRYLRAADYVDAALLPTKSDLQRTLHALDLIGIEQGVRAALLRIVAAVLHLGNIEIDVDPSQEHAVITKKDPLLAAASLLVVDAESLERVILTRTITAEKKTVAISLKPREAEDCRDGIAKAIYQRLFDWLVSRINLSTNSEKERKNIGLLDIFGFECFQENSLEQLNINYTNEKLQMIFIQDVLDGVQREYEEEEVPFPRVNIPNNNSVLELIESSSGIFAVLTDECRWPRGSDSGFLSKLMSKRGDRPPLQRPHAKQAHNTFIINHYAGNISYSVTGFLDKNKDTVRPEAISLLSDSDNIVLSELFLVSAGFVDELSSSMGSRRSSSILGGGRGTIVAQSLCLQFQEQLEALRAAITRTELHYIRCVKPNSLKSSHLFEGRLVLDQLRLSGIIEAVHISRSAHPVRISYHDFWAQYHVLHPLHKNTPVMPSQEESIALLEDLITVGGYENRFKTVEMQKKSKNIQSPVELEALFDCGKTKLFFRDNLLHELNLWKLERFDSLVVKMQAAARRFLIRTQYLQWRASAILIQRCMRRHLASSELQRRKAATFTLQRVGRGYLDRRYVRMLRAHQTLMSFVRHVVRIHRLKHRLQLIQRLRRNSAARSVQRARRSCVQRREFEKQISRQNHAALKIQTAYRMSRERRQFLRTKWAAVKLQSVARMLRDQLTACNVSETQAVQTSLVSLPSIGEDTSIQTTKSMDNASAVSPRGRSADQSYDRCPHCARKTLSRLSNTFCIYCGGSFSGDGHNLPAVGEHASRGPEEGLPVVQGTGHGLCANCGTSLLPESTFCFLCGTVQNSAAKVNSTPFHQTNALHSQTNRAHSQEHSMPGRSSSTANSEESQFYRSNSRGRVGSREGEALLCANCHQETSAAAAAANTACIFCGETEKVVVSGTSAPRRYISPQASVNLDHPTPNDLDSGYMMRVPPPSSLPSMQGSLHNGQQQQYQMYGQQLQQMYQVGSQPELPASAFLAREAAARRAASLPSASPSSTSSSPEAFSHRPAPVVTSHSAEYMSQSPAVTSYIDRSPMHHSNSPASHSSASPYAQLLKPPNSSLSFYGNRRSMHQVPPPVSFPATASSSSHGIPTNILFPRTSEGGAMNMDTFGDHDHQRPVEDAAYPNHRRMSAPMHVPSTAAGISFAAEKLMPSSPTALPTYFRPKSAGSMGPRGLDSTGNQSDWNEYDTDPRHVRAGLIPPSSPSTPRETAAGSRFNQMPAGHESDFHGSDDHFITEDDMADEFEENEKLVAENEDGPLLPAGGMEHLHLPAVPSYEFQHYWQPLTHKEVTMLRVFPAIEIQLVSANGASIAIDAKGFLYQSQRPRSSGFTREMIFHLGRHKQQSNIIYLRSGVTHEFIGEKGVLGKKPASTGKHQHPNKNNAFFLDRLTDINGVSQPDTLFAIRTVGSGKLLTVERDGQIGFLKPSTYVSTREQAERANVLMLQICTLKHHVTYEIEYKGEDLGFELDMSPPYSVRSLRSNHLSLARSPAEESGLVHVGDKLLAVNGVPVKDISGGRALQQILSTRKISLVFQRSGWRIFQVLAKIDVLQNPSVDSPRRKEFTLAIGDEIIVIDTIDTYHPQTGRPLQFLRLLHEDGWIPSLLGERQIIKPVAPPMIAMGG